jgi:hypothetical protein
MQTRTRRVAIAVLLALLAGPADAQERMPVEPPTAAQLAELQDRVAALESRVAALEAEQAGVRPGGEAIERVGLLADRAMRRLLDMVRVLKHGRKDEKL